MMVSALVCRSESCDTRKGRFELMQSRRDEISPISEMLYKAYKKRRTKIGIKNIIEIGAGNKGKRRGHVMLMFPIQNTEVGYWKAKH